MYARELGNFIPKSALALEKTTAGSSSKSKIKTPVENEAKLTSVSSEVNIIPSLELDADVQPSETFKESLVSEIDVMDVPDTVQITNQPAAQSNSKRKTSSRHQSKNEARSSSANSHDPTDVFAPNDVVHKDIIVHHPMFMFWQVCFFLLVVCVRLF